MCFFTRQRTLPCFALRSVTTLLRDSPRINPEALDAFVETWAEADQNGRETIAKARNALLEEFDIDRLARTISGGLRLNSMNCRICDKETDPFLRISTADLDEPFLDATLRKQLPELRLRRCR